MIGPGIPPHLFEASSSSHQDRTSDPESGPGPIGPRIPPSLFKASATSTTPSPSPAVEEDDDDDDYAPALPPELAAARSTAKRVIGPTLPTAAVAPSYDDDEDEDDVGPRPLPAGYLVEEKDGVQEFLEREERRRKNLEVCLLPSCSIPSFQHITNDCVVLTC